MHQGPSNHRGWEESGTSGSLVAEWHLRKEEADPKHQRVLQMEGIVPGGWELQDWLGTQRRVEPEEATFQGWGPPGGEPPGG